jgi:hypothetical protein
MPNAFRIQRNGASREESSWHIAPEILHEGFLADFVMRNEAMIRG